MIDKKSKKSKKRGSMYRKRTSRVRGGSWAAHPIKFPGRSDGVDNSWLGSLPYSRKEVVELIEALETRMQHDLYSRKEVVELIEALETRMQHDLKDSILALKTEFDMALRKIYSKCQVSLQIDKRRMDKIEKYIQPLVPDMELHKQLMGEIYDADDDILNIPGLPPRT